MDQMTHWPEAIPLASVSAGPCSHAFLQDKVARFRVRCDIWSDRGPQFTSALWAFLSTSLGTSHHTKTAHHLQNNGLVETFHCSLKSVLRACLMSPNLVNELPWTLLALCCTVKLDLDSSPRKLIFCHSPLLPGEIFSHWLSLLLLSLVACHHSSCPPSSMPGLDHTQFVFTQDDIQRGPLRPPYHRPFLVVARHAKDFLVDVSGSHDNVSIDRLKPAW